MKRKWPIDEKEAIEAAAKFWLDGSRDAARLMLELAIYYQSKTLVEMRKAEHAELRKKMNEI